MFMNKYLVRLAGCLDCIFNPFQNRTSLYEAERNATSTGLGGRRYFFVVASVVCQLVYFLRDAGFLFRTAGAVRSFACT